MLSELCKLFTIGGSKGGFRLVSKKSSGSDHCHLLVKAHDYNV